MYPCDFLDLRKVPLRPNLHFRDPFDLRADARVAAVRMGSVRLDDMKDGQACTSTLRELHGHMSRFQ